MRFVSDIVRIIFCYYFFPPEVVFRYRVVGAFSVTTDCIVAMSSCEDNNKIALVLFLIAVSEIRPQTAQGGASPCLAEYCSVAQWVHLKTKKN